MRMNRRPNAGVLVALLSGVSLAAPQLTAQDAPCTNGDPNCTSFPGAVGIGTTAPAQKLEVFDGFLQSTRPVGSTLSAGIWFRQDNVAGNQGIWSIASRNAGELAFYNGAFGDVFKAFPNSQVGFTGNVGIGTFTPGQTLELVRENADIGIRFHDPGDVWFSTGINTASGRKFFIGRGSYPGEIPDFTMSPTTGNVGIGTAIAPEKLTIAGAIRVGDVTVINSSGQWVGDPTGLVGPPGAPGVHTVAICGVSGNAECQGMCGISGGNIVSCVGGALSGCSATSTTGSCSIPAAASNRCAVCKAQ